VIIGDYSTAKILDAPTSGYITNTNPVRSTTWLSQDLARIQSVLQLAVNEHRELLLVMASWESELEEHSTLKVLNAFPAFIEETRIADGANIWLRVYRYHVDQGTPVRSTSQTNRRGFAIRLYRLLLDRSIDLAALESWDFKIAGASDMRRIVVKGLRDLTESPEFQRHCPNPEIQIAKVYDTMLERQPTRQETERWALALSAKTKSLGDLIEMLGNDPAFTALLGKYAVSPSAY